MRIFLSFAYDEDKNEANGFRGMLENPDANIDFVDGSCKRDYGDKTDAEIDAYIRSLIEQSSVTVCLISQHTKNSDWVDRELELSSSKGKGIVGIVLQKSLPWVTHTSNCPSAFHTGRYKCYTWASPQVMSTLIQEAEKRR